MPGTAPAGPASKPKPKLAEDVPGVPTAAWARVKRGVPASDPFKPGEGFILMVDGARFLPGVLPLAPALKSLQGVPDVAAPIASCVSS